MFITKKCVQKQNNKTHSEKIGKQVNNHCHIQRTLCFVSCEGIQGLAIKKRDRAHRKRHRRVRGKTNILVDSWKGFLMV